MLTIQYHLLAFFITCLFTVTAKDYGVNARELQNAITWEMPLERIVFQRDQNNQAVVPVKAVFKNKPSAFLQVRLVPRQKGQGRATAWHRIAIQTDGSVNGFIEATGGWYRMEIKIPGRRKKTVAVERVGIGEVFVVVGHSVAQGGEINAPGATDDRVSTVALDKHAENFDKKYLTTGDPAYLPEPLFSRAESGVVHAPFGHGSYFWSSLAEKIAVRENVPVLIFNAAFGGTNLEHWVLSAKGQQFEHGFVRSGIRMPYINLLNTFNKYIVLTGLRALLADHGQNDAGEKDPEKIFKNYKFFITQARNDLRYPHLALVVNRQHPPQATAVRTAQERMLQLPDCFPGPDYDRDLDAADTYDGVHLSAAGVEKAATLWAVALDQNFFTLSNPYLPAFR